MIGVYGGSFDPIHLGHLKTAKFIKNELGLNRILLLPCNQPVHRQPLHYSASQRLEILNLALKDFSELEVDNSEIDRGGDSYMIDTLKDLKVKLNNESICLVIGMDSFVNFKSWKNWDEFSKIVHLIVLPREGKQPIEKALETFEVSSDIKQIKSEANGLLYFSKTGMINISSTAVRGRISENQSLDKFLPKSVINYLNNL